MAARAKTKTSKANNSVKKLSRRGSTTRTSVKESTMQVPMTSTENLTPSELKSKKKSIYLLVGIALVLGLLYYFKDLFVVATVNGRPISRMSVVRELEKQNGKSTIENLVTKELVLQEASKKGIRVNQEDIDNELKKIEDDLSKQGQKLDDVLAMQGLTKADVEENLRVKLYIEKILADQVTVSDDEAKKYFDENKTLFAEGSNFDSEKEQVKEQLKQQKLQEQFQTWLNDLKANAKINYFKTY